MNATLIRRWPPTGLSAMALLGLFLGHGSNPVDDWFIGVGHHHRVLHRLLIFTDPRVLVVLVIAALAVALWRRRRGLAVVVVLSPLIGIAAARLLKEVFDRYKGDPPQLAYPSGHVTATVVVLGMLLLVLGARRWVVIAAAVWTVLAMLAESFTYHYFTDTIGALLLGTSLVCLAARVVGLDRCQPGCDVRHSGG